MATNADRNRASRYRKSLAAGKATDAQRAWLRTYEEQRDGRNVVPISRAPTYPAPHEPPPPADTDVVGVGWRVEPPPIATSPKPVDVPIPHWTAPTTSLAPAACTIPDCPACKGQRGALVCLATGKKVWPPMGEAGARAMAGTIFFFLGLGVRFIRSDKQLILPTDRELDDMAKALREVALRRASWVGAVDDLFGLVGALTSYGRRAFKEPPRAI